MFRPLRPRTAYVLSSALLLGSVSCTGGPTATDEIAESAPGSSDAVAAAAAEPSATLHGTGRDADVSSQLEWRGLSTAELELELRRDRAGKVLLQALRAHGGWDSWRSIARVSIRSSRETFSHPIAAAANDPSVTPGDVDDSVAVDSPAPTAVRVVEASSHDYAFDIRPAGFREEESPTDAAPTPDSGELSPSQRRFLQLLPFALVDERLTADYVGVEKDLETDESLAKVKYTLPGTSRRTGSSWVTVYFDRTGHHVRRALLRLHAAASEPGGAGTSYLLVVFDDVRPSSNSRQSGDVLLARRLTAFRLKRRTSHADFDKPDSVESITEIELIPKESTGGSGD